MVITSCSNSRKKNFVEAERILKLGKYRDLLTFLKTEKDSTDNEFYYLRGVAEYKLNLLKNSLSDLTIYLKGTPDDTLGLEYRANVLIELDSLNMAVVDMNKLIALNKYKAEVYNKRGLIYQNQNKWDLAFDDFNNSIKCDSSLFKPYCNLGLLYEDKKDYKKSIIFYTKAIEKNRYESTIYFNRGVAYLYLKKSSLSVADFNTAIKINPKDGSYYLNRGIAYFYLNNFQNAREDWNKAYLFGITEAKDYLDKYCKPNSDENKSFNM